MDNKKTDIVKNRIKCLLLSILLVSSITGCESKENVPENTTTSASDIEKTSDNSSTYILDNSVIDKNSEGTYEAGVPSGGSLQVHFVDVGQGDCSLIICGDEAMLIDAGDNSRGTKVQKYIKDHGITELKYVVGTHPDADHIGGLDVVIYKFTCQNILMPEASSDNKSYLDVMSAVDSKGQKVKIVGEGDSFTLGDAKIEILSPVKGYPYAENNNNSIILRLDYYNNSFLFMGDAEYQPQQVIIYDDELNAKADVVKVSHHGANSGYLKAFYDEADPAYAVISVGNDNDYGHPHENVLNDFKNRGVKVFRTDEQGTIVALSDGNNITFNTEPSVTWAVGSVSESSNSKETSVTQNTGSNHYTEPASDVTYVLNINSMKFHFPKCDSVKDMKQKNRVDVSCSREELLLEYPDAVSCKRCNP